MAPLRPAPTGASPSVTTSGFAARVPPLPSADAIRVMIVDDSAVVRGLMARLLDEHPQIRVVASVANGQLAIAKLREQPADVVVLDIEMPVMDGISALPHLLAVDPQVRVIVASTLTTRNAEISLKCLGGGAADYVPKPTTAREVGGLAGGSDGFRRELLEKVLAHGAFRRRVGGTNAGADGAGPRVAASRARFPGASGRDRTITLRHAAAARPHILAVGSSTGGPQALKVFLSALGPGFPLPILIAQHMPPKFTAILAEHIMVETGRRCSEAEDGEPIRSDRIYIAPGDFHLRAAVADGARIIRLSQDAAQNFCRPAVDPLFDSLASAYGSRALAVVLTGMGSDGLKGAQAIVHAGGTVLAQDEASSVVWGMPGAVALAGLCSVVQPLAELAATVRALAAGTAP